MRIDDSFYMSLAINEAWECMLLTYPNPSVGACVVRAGALLGVGAHKRAGSSHAEVVALLNAYESLSGSEVDFDKLNANRAHSFLLENRDIFRDCEIYVTLEPCSHIGKTPSCANLIKSLGLKKVYIGSSDPVSAHSGGAAMLKSADIEVECGVLKQECDALIEPFKIWRKRAFVIFKLAQSVNGVIGGGYLSSKESLIHTHKIREVSTKLLIGGNTVRVDKPTLDCRFINSSAPDVAIYSKEGGFSKDIPLFAVKDRDVEIVDNLKFLNTKGVVLVEGGEGMLKALKDKIDWLLVYQTPKIREKSVAYNLNLDIEFLKVIENKKDLLIWSRVSNS